MIMSTIEKNDAPFFKVDDLVVEYTSDGQIVHAVNGVSFQLKKGRALALVGETGAGKTTIAKTILRILPDYAAHIRNGNVLLEGEDLLKVSEKEMRHIRGNKIAMIFQDPMTALNPVMTVGKQIAEAIKLHYGVSRSESYKRAAEMLEMVDIPGDRISEYPHQFSGGMKQRVVIAMALACRPELILADEPTTALDVTIQLQVLQLIKKLRDELNTSMILITHDFGVVAEACDDVAVIYAGRIVEMGAKEDIFLHTAHPYTKGLFGSIPHINSDVDRLSPIDGLPPDPTNLPVGCYFSPRCPFAIEACKSGEVIPLTEVRPGHFCRCINYKKEE
ncbi:MAG: ABC transporter ATP-binding protein [Lachnospiraceae bacterium]|jgi:peptide/nickel transport system ATP-binding protein